VEYPMKNKDLINWAKNEAETLLIDMPQRLKHIKSVGKRAEYVSKILDESDREILIAAAYLHDIGYSEKLNKTNFHPLDGAVYLKNKGLERIASLVAHHSCAENEAKLVGIYDKLSEFKCDDELVLNALSYCDWTTSPFGEKVTVEERINEIIERFGADSLITKSIKQTMSFRNKVKEDIEYRLRKI
jgi:HD superfamily phosphodiesterase